MEDFQTILYDKRDMNLRRNSQQRSTSPIPSWKVFAILLASTAAVASVQAAPGYVAKSKRAFLDQVPGFGQPSQTSAKSRVVGGSDALEEDVNVSEEEAIQLLSNPAEQSKATMTKSDELGAWPCMDELDEKLIKISLPVIATFAIAPVIGAIDLFFLNRLGNALAVAGQGAATQVYGSVFWLTSFIPSSEYCSCIACYYVLRISDSATTI